MLKSDELSAQMIKTGRMFRECPFVTESFKSDGAILLVYATVDFDKNPQIFVDTLKCSELMCAHVEEQKEDIEMYLEQIAEGSYEYKYGMSKKETKREIAIGQAFIERLQVETDKLWKMLNNIVDNLSVTVAERSTSDSQT